MYVLNVDLWSMDGTKEVNLVRHSATSPQISNTLPTSYGLVEATNTPAFHSILPGQSTSVNIIRDRGQEPTSPHFSNPPGAYPSQGQGAPYNPYPGPPQVNPYSQPQSAQPAYGGAQYQPGYPPNTNGNGNYPPANGYQAGPTTVYTFTGNDIHAAGRGQPQGDYRQGIDYSPANQSLPPHSALQSYGGRTFTNQDVALHRMPVSSTQPTGMFTRNLIGSLSASAFRLTDPDDRIGIWFVLQDLSVRTEGDFRYILPPLYPCPVLQLTNSFFIVFAFLLST